MIQHHEPLPGVPLTRPRVVAFGGGHGLAATLSALRKLTPHIVAVVTVADDRGSSGRIRDELDVLPPGDLRKALAALAGDGGDSRIWAELLEHRFGGSGTLSDHAVGNLLITGLADTLGDPVGALDLVARSVGAVGRVLPMTLIPLQIAAEVVGLDGTDPTAVRHVVGQGEVATTLGHVISVSLIPSSPPACPQAVEAIKDADAVILGPGSWYTSVLPHVLVPQLYESLVHTPARRILTLNLAAEPGETKDFSPQRHLEVLHQYAPDLRFDAVIADVDSVSDTDALRPAVSSFGASLVLARVAAEDGSPRHDRVRLASVLAEILFGYSARVVDSCRTTHGEADRWP